MQHTILKLQFSLLLFWWSTLMAWSQDLLTADAERMEQRILKLSTYGANPQGGVSRPGFGPADIEARQYIMSIMESLGLEVIIDAAGNILGRRPGTDNDLPFISFGSHIDSVPYGGSYDGNVGVIGALECIELLNEHNLVTRHPLEIIVFVAEEDGLFGSKGMTGTLTQAELDFIGNSGKTVKQGIIDVGGNPHNLPAAARQSGEIRYFLELHIEQGAILEMNNLNIGVVEGIVGIEEWQVTVTGKANHSGTTPMNLRQDALLAASELIIAVNKIIRMEKGSQVATIGELEVRPNVSNIVPGRVVLTLEMRDLNSEKTQAIYERIKSRAQTISRETNTEIAFEHQLSMEPAIMEENIQQVIAAAAADLDLSYMVMPSGAGHDAQDMAKITSAGMIFVPSKGGISHAPQEFTSAGDMANGASVLLRTILKLDELK